MGCKRKERETEDSSSRGPTKKRSRLTCERWGGAGRGRSEREGEDTGGGGTGVRQGVLTWKNRRRGRGERGGKGGVRLGAATNTFTFRTWAFSGCCLLSSRAASSQEVDLVSEGTAGGSDRRLADAQRRKRNETHQVNKSPRPPPWCRPHPKRPDSTLASHIASRRRSGRGGAGMGGTDPGRIL